MRTSANNPASLSSLVNSKVEWELFFGWISCSAMSPWCLSLYYFLLEGQLTPWQLRFPEGRILRLVSHILTSSFHSVSVLLFLKHHNSDKSASTDPSFPLLQSRCHFQSWSLPSSWLGQLPQKSFLVSNLSLIISSHLSFWNLSLTISLVCDPVFPREPSHSSTSFILLMMAHTPMQRKTSNIIFVLCGR